MRRAVAMFGMSMHLSSLMKTLGFRDFIRLLGFTSEGTSVIFLATDAIRVLA